MSGGSDLFYLFIFAIWLRRDVERKREKSRCAQLLAAALAAQDLVPRPAELEQAPRPLPPPPAPWDVLVAPPGTCHVPAFTPRGVNIYAQTGSAQMSSPGLQRTRCWPHAGLVATTVGTPGRPQPQVMVALAAGMVPAHAAGPAA